MAGPSGVTMPRDDDFSAGPYDLGSPPDWAAFPGLYPPLYTQTPDVFFDWVAPFLPEIELRVLLYLIRRTLGFKKQGDQITVEQIAGGIVTREGSRLDWGARLGERSVQRALAGLETKGLIERHRQLDPDRGWRPSYIRLRLCDQDGESWAIRGRAHATPGVWGDTSLVSRRTPPSRPPRHQGGVPAATPDHREPSVSSDTYKKQRSHYTEQQETVPLPPIQETGADGRPAAELLWDAIKGELAAVLAPAVYQARVAPTAQVSHDGSILTVRCPTAAAAHWLDRQLARMIGEITAGLADDPPTVRFTAPE
ncbi:MAG: helix-turn-helix transcriptional regulator [Chloroflexota bacterium]